MLLFCPRLLSPQTTHTYIRFQKGSSSHLPQTKSRIYAHVRTAYDRSLSKLCLNRNPWIDSFLRILELTVSTFFLLDMSWLIIKPIQFTNQMNEFAFDSANGFIYASQTQCTLTSIPTSISLTIRRSDTRWLVIESSFEKFLEHFFIKGHGSS